MKSIIIFLSLGFSIQIFSEEGCTTCKKTPEEYVKMAKQTEQIFQKELPLCTEEENKIWVDAQNEFLKYFPEGSKIISGTIHGMSLTGTAEQLQIAKKILAEPGPPKWKEKVAGCTDVICVMEKLVGSKDAALRMFNVAKRNGYIIRLGRFNDHPSWIEGHQLYNSNQIRSLDEGFKMMPQELNKLSHVDGYFRIPDGSSTKGTEDAAAWARSYIGPIMSYDGKTTLYKGSPGIIVFQENTFSNEKWTKLVLIHETCHHYDFQGDYQNGVRRTDSPSFGFNKLSKWKKNVEKDGELKWQHDDKDQFVTTYASTAPVEDFAESCAYYIADPETLKAKAPEKYEFMKKKVFHGQEFAAKNEPSWIGIEDLLEDEKLCSAFYFECLTSFKIDPDRCFATWDNGHSWTFSSLLSFNSGASLENDCFKEKRETQTKKFLQTLSENRKEYCYQGGEPRVRNLMSNSFCRQSFLQGLNRCDEIRKLDTKEIQNSCIEKKDYSKDCVVDQIIPKIKISNLDKAATKAIIAKIIPIPPIAKAIEDVSAAKLFVSCLLNMNDLRSMTSTKGEKSYIYRDRDSKENKNHYHILSANYNFFGDSPCTNKYSEVLVKSGYKIGDSVNERTNITDAIEADPKMKSVFTDFFSSVADKSEAPAKECATKIFGSKKCQTDVFKPLVLDWWKKYSKDEMPEEMQLKIFEKLTNLYQ